MKLKYKHLLLLLLLCSPTYILLAQTTLQPSYTLSSKEAGDKTYAARDYISLKPGFSYNGSQGFNFKAMIGAGLPSPTPNPDETQGDSIIIDPALGVPVGSIPGQFGVSPSGAASYNIPIECPAGINGIQPNISLAYNSQSGNGVAGWGWNISGLSAITRTGSTFYHDGKVASPQLTNDDNLMLNGQRLILVYGRHLYDGAKYRTEIENYSDITFRTINGNLCFEVKTKEGLTMEFGTSSDSYIEAQGSSVPLCWLLTKVTDANGNYMTYSYGENNATGEYWLNKIKYTCNDAAGVTTGANEVEFVYDNLTPRLDIQTGYIAGRKISVSKRIDFIYAKTNGQIQRKYILKYRTDAFTTQLKQINVEGANGVKLNPSIINWGIPGTYSKNGSEDMIFLNNQRDNIVNFVDINKDGRCDFLTYLQKTQYSSSDSAKIFTAFYSIYAGGNGFTKKFAIPLTNASKTWFLYGDFNGDGYLDLMRTARIESPFQLIRTFFLFDGTKFTEKATISSTVYKDPIIGDFNGDGKDEVVMHDSYDKTNVYDYNGNCIASGEIPLWGTSLQIEAGGNNVRNPFDFNGNGKTDILLTQVNSVNGTPINLIYELNGNTFQQIHSGTEFGGIDALTSVGDFNGDGYSDILVRKAPSSCDFFYSNGVSFEKKTYSNVNLLNNQVEVVDINKDGKSDLTYFKNDGTTHTTEIFTSTGDGFVKSQYPSTQIDPKNFNQPVAIDDFDGDGRSELCYAKWSDALVLQSFDDKQNLLVNSITDGLNNQVAFTYSSISDNYPYTENAISYSFPVSRMRSPIYVVNSVTTGLDNLYYSYKNARVHRQGKGFLGFGEVSVTDYANNKISKTQYGYDPVYFNVYPTVQTVTTRNSTLPISTTIFENNKIEFNSGRIMPYVSKQTVTDHLTEITSVTQTSNFDDGGNAQTIETTIGNRINTKNILFIKKGAYCKNKISTITEYNKLTDGRSQTRKKEYSYNDNGNLTQEIIDSGDINAVTTDYKNFDMFGRAKTVEISANGKKRTSGITYSGMFIDSKTNSLNETTTYNWDQTRGLLNFEIDYRNNKTEYVYDSWGQLIETRYPTGIKKIQVLKWAQPNNSMGARYYSYSETLGTAPVTVWYDTHGREIQRDTYGLNSKKVSVATEYNSAGKIYRVSEPFFEQDAASKVWAKTYHYDDYGRTDNVATTMGNIVSVYNKKTTLVTTPESTQETTLNEAGQIRTSKVNQKTVTYTYHPSGLTETATPEGGQPLQMFYNLQGKRIRLIDPDAGLVRTEYNGFGELIKEVQKIHKDKDSIVTVNEYDANGLLQNINRNNEITTYIYNDQYKSRLKSIEILGKNKQEFSYDNFDRVTDIKETIGSKVFIKTTNYDYLGRAEKEIYPSGYYTLNTYDQFSNLTEIKDVNNRSIWKAIDENARGQLTNITKGGRACTFGFDSRGLPTSIVAPGIQNMEYLFDAKGNLEYRIDNLAKQKEQFLYDGFNRLTNWDVYQNGSGVSSKKNSIVYNVSTSNIDSKSDLGVDPSGNVLQMKYGVYNSDANNSALINPNPGPHALTSISYTPVNFPTADLNVTYTDFKKVATLHEGNKDYTLTYGVDDQRCMSEYKVAGVTQQTRYYVGDYEEEIDAAGNIRKIHYLSGAIMIRTNSVETLYYSYADYQGSLMALTDVNGNVVEKYAYDPWGARRNPENWTLVDNRASWITNRGYTGHEHLDAFGIINMNGRVYDPLTAQFFSPDPYVQDPDNWLNYNRYTYCFGNPFKYSDPSGENPLLFIAGFLINSTINYLAGVRDSGYKNWTPNLTFGIGYSSTGGAFVGVSTNGGAQFTNLGITKNGFTKGTTIDGVTNMEPLNCAPLNGVVQWTVGFYNYVTDWNAVKRDLTDWNAWQNQIPVYGSGKQAFEAILDGGDFLRGINLFGIAFFEAYTAGLGAEATIALKAELTVSKRVYYTMPIEQGGGLASKVVTETVAAKGSANVIEQAAVHGNSLKSLKPTWGYKLYSTDGTFLKNGITSKLIPETRYTKSFMLDKKMVPFKQFPNRLDAWQWEYQQNLIQRGPLNLNMH